MAEPDSTAERVALWRAMHVLVDAPPHVLEDEIGLRLVSPGDDWRSRPDMDPEWTGPFRAGMVARGPIRRRSRRRQQHQRRLPVRDARRRARHLRAASAGPRVTARVYEIDRAGAQAWKRERLAALGYDEPEWLHFLSVDFESGGSWWDALIGAGFDAQEPSVVASTGVSMYLTKHATAATLRQPALLPRGSTLAMTFLLPTELLDEADRPGL